jgi:uncharacterized membrane protein HdeD (DUF308 family)
MIIQAFRGGGWGIGIMGVIGILIGIFLLANTLLGTQIVIWLSALTLIVGGIAAVVVAFRAR